MLPLSMDRKRFFAGGGAMQAAPLARGTMRVSEKCKLCMRRACANLGGPVQIKPTRGQMRASECDVTLGWRSAFRLPQPIGIRSGIARHSYRQGNAYWYNHRAPGPPGCRLKGKALGSLVRCTAGVAEVIPVGSVHRNEDSKERETGPEDPRFFSHKGRLWCVCNGPSKEDPQKRAMHLVDLERGTSVQLSIESRKPRSVEKNWTPMVVDGELWLVYSLQPLCILELMSEKSGECKVVHGNLSVTDAADRVRGGTPLVELRDGWYGGFGHLAVCRDDSTARRELLYDAVSVLLNVNTKETKLGPIIDLKRRGAMPRSSPGDEETLGLAPRSPMSIVFPYHFEPVGTGYSLAFTYQDAGDIEYFLSVSQLRAIGWPL